MNDCNRKLKELREAALSAGIPITRGSAYDFLLERVRTLVEEHTKIGADLIEPFHILELGTAVGLTSIALARTSSRVHVTSVELNEERHKIAAENVRTFGLGEQISLHLADAGAFLDAHPTGERYHFIYIDGPKAQYMRHFEHAWTLLRTEGVIVIDNVDFHRDSKRYKTINKRMDDFRNFVLHIGGIILPEEGMAVVVKDQTSIIKEREWRNRR